MLGQRRVAVRATRPTRTSSAAPSASTACPSVVIGVMPDGFGFPVTAEIWQPLAMLSAEERDDRNGRVPLRVRPAAAGRLARPGARRISGRVMTGLAARHPETNRQTEPRIAPFRVGVGGPIRVLFAALLGAVTFVLLIACANVANLLLARAAGRDARGDGAHVDGREPLAHRPPAARGEPVARRDGRGLRAGLSVVGVRLFWSVAQDYASAVLAALPVRPARVRCTSPRSVSARPSSSACCRRCRRRAPIWSRC